MLALAAAVIVAPSASALDDCVPVKPLGGDGVCASTGGEGVCAVVDFDWRHSDPGACVDVRDGSATVCTPWFSGPGGCDTVSTDPDDCDIHRDVCVISDGSETCAVAFLSTHGYGACVDTATGDFRVCISGQILIFGSCVEDADCTSTLSLPSTTTCTFEGYGIRCSGPYVGTGPSAGFGCTMIGFDCFAVEWGIDQGWLKVGGSGCGSGVWTQPPVQQVVNAIGL